VTKGMADMSGARAAVTAASDEVAVAQKAAEKAASALEEKLVLQKTSVLRLEAIEVDVETARAAVAQKQKAQDASAVEIVAAGPPNSPLSRSTRVVLWSFVCGVSSTETPSNSSYGNS